MPIQAPQWSDFRLCPVCQNEFNTTSKLPVSLGCAHSICQSCLLRLCKQQCPFDQALIQTDIHKLPVNYALLSLVGGKIPDVCPVDIPDVKNNQQLFEKSRKVVEYLAQYLQGCTITSSSSSSTSSNGGMTRPMQRKLVSLIHCQLVEEEGRIRAMRAARSIGERAVKELILMHQSPQTLSAALWAAVRQRGCQFLGPAMQDAVLKLILLSLEDGIQLSRKVLVLFVVQKLEKQFTQASKTSIGHVVQLLYRASCFKVTKREGDSSLLQLHEKYRTYSALRKEHDAQIVQIAMEAGLHISPEQWSALLYGDDEHKSHMQSIIDKLQTPESFGSSIQELVIALQRTDDPHTLQDLRSHLERLAAVDASTEQVEPPTWSELDDTLSSLKVVMQGLHDFTKEYASRNRGNIEGSQMINTKYRTSMCRDIINRNSCPRGANCNFAHTEEELDRHRRKRFVAPSTGAGRLQNGGMMHSVIQGGDDRLLANGAYPQPPQHMDEFAFQSVPPPGQEYNNAIIRNEEYMRSGASSSPESMLEDEFIDPPSVQVMNGGSPLQPGQLSPAGVGFRPVATTTHIITSSLPPPSLRHTNHPSPPLHQHDRDVLSENMKNLSFSQQTPSKKDINGNHIKLPPNYHTTQTPARVSPSDLVHYNAQQQSHAPYYESSIPPQTQPSIYPAHTHHVPSAYISNGHPQQVYQQQVSTHHMYPYAQYDNSYGYGQPPTVQYVYARSADNFTDSDETKELKLKIPNGKDEVKEEWKSSKYSTRTTESSSDKYSNHGDSCIDSGRGSSLGYSSDAFSPLSNTSSDSQGSPPTTERKEHDCNGISCHGNSSSHGNNAATKSWDTFFSNQAIWAPQKESGSSKLKTWAMKPEESKKSTTSKPARPKDWDDFGVPRHSTTDTRLGVKGKVPNVAEILSPSGEFHQRSSSYSRINDWKMENSPRQVCEVGRFSETQQISKQAESRRQMQQDFRIQHTRGSSDLTHNRSPIGDLERQSRTPSSAQRQSEQRLLSGMLGSDLKNSLKLNPPPGFSY